MYTPATQKSHTSMDNSELWKKTNEENGTDLLSRSLKGEVPRFAPENAEKIILPPFRDPILSHYFVSF